MAARYSARLNGITQLAITKFDVLSGMETVKVCTGYRVGDKVLDRFPRDLSVLDSVEPVLEELEGWSDSVTEARAWDDLPDAARRYLDFVTERMELPIAWLSVGADRKQTLRVGATV